MAQRKQNMNKKSSLKYRFGVALIIISAFFLLCIIIPPFIGVVSKAIKNVTIGTFGFMAYPIFICALLLGVAFIQNKRLKVSYKTLGLILTIVFFAVMIMQLATSQNYIGNGFNSYVSKVFKNFTAGGVVFGFMVYGVQAAVTIVFSYIVYSLCLILFSYFLVKDKYYETKSGNRRERISSPKNSKEFRKGLTAPQQVKPLADTTLFVDTIIPANNNIYTEQGSFNELNSLGKHGKQKPLQQYSTQVPLKYNDKPENGNTLENDKKAKALNFLYGDKNAPFQISPSSYKSDNNPDNSLNEQKNISYQQYLPPLVSSVPSIKMNESETPEPKKPPKILHIEDFPELKKIAMPPPKDVSGNYVPGTIINGEELSKKLAEKFTPLNPEQDKNNIISNINNFDKRKIEPGTILPKKEYNIINRNEEKPFEDKPEQEFNNSAPILNGDFFGRINYEEKKSEPVNNYSSDYESVYSDKDVYDDINNYENDNYNNYSDDEPIDLSERSYDNKNDYTGYYTPVADPEAKLSFITPSQSSLKLKPENQIKMDDYAKNLAPEKSNKVKKRRTKYNPPPIELLLSSKININDDSENENEKARMLEETLRGLKLPATVNAITRGPAVTRYELDMPPGIPVKRIEQFAKDIEYNLASNGRIRIETPIPGKRAVGIEVPNEFIDIVALKDIINSKEFINSSSPLTLALGKDIAGSNIICCLDKMPHLLIAGATGSGKSACLNSIIISILYKSSPEDVRLILIDPKHVEFTIYKNLPHLLTSEIITDANQALNAFKWTKVEMDRRYLLFSKHVVRNLQEYNKLDVVKNGEEEKLPYIVLIVDELAELMMSNNRKDLEDKIMSMAQKARAAGIHLILATQRPSVDVITGTIKANLPSRIAFSVKSVIDSRTILDESGAETLLGRGDMLYAPSGVDDARRVQGSFVTNEEVTTIVDYVKENNTADFDEDFSSSLVEKEETDVNRDDEEESEFDPLMSSVLRLVIETGTASTTFIQRRFAVGYARASRIMDQMETHKFVGPLEGSKPRAVYISRGQYAELFGEEI